jgi:hypothetical protein
MMRKTTTILAILCLLCFKGFAQKNYFSKNLVLIEIGTATWCVYCPGVAMAVDQMEAEGLDVAVIENHGDDDYETIGSLARNDFYGITAFPTGVFNGTKTIVGGGTTTCYLEYRKKYEEAKLDSTAFSLSMEVTHTGGNNYKANIKARKLDYYDGTNTNIFLVITQSHIPCAWMGQTEVNFVNRMMVTGDNGQAFCFDCSGNYNSDFSFTIPENWDKTHLQAVAFIQDMDSKEILNAAKDTVPEPVFWNAASINSIVEPGDLSCVNKISPQLKIKNDGKSNLKYLLINYWMNAETKYHYEWTGDIITDSITTVTLPEISFKPLSGTNQLNFSIELPNNAADELPEGNSYTFNFLQTWQKNRFLEIKTSTDYYGDETSWELLNNQGEIVLEGKNFSSGADHYAYFEPENNSCYTFKAYDSGGDGITEGGRIELIDFYSQVTMSSFAEFGSLAEINFGTTYKQTPSLSMKSEFGQGIADGDMLVVKGYANDSIISLGLKILNETPVNQWLQVESQIIEGNEDIEACFMWNNKIEYQTGDSLKLSGLSTYKYFKPFIHPNGTVDTIIVSYKVWSDSINSIQFNIQYISQQNPPLIIKLKDLEGNYYSNNDTIIYEGFESEMQDIDTKVKFENLSVFGIKIDVAQRINAPAGNFTFEWDPLLEMAANDTNFQFLANFKNYGWFGNLSATYTFIPQGYSQDSLTLTTIYKIKPNANYELLLVNGSDSTSNIELTYQLSDTCTKPIIIDSIKLLSKSYYDIQVQLEEKTIDGSPVGIDSTFWIDKNYMGANQVFAEILKIAPNQTEQYFSTSLYPPFTEGSFIKKFIFRNPDNIEHHSDIQLTFQVVKDTISAIIENEDLTKKLNIWPNPANKLIYLELPIIQNIERVEVNITNLFGKIVQSQTDSDTQQNIQLDINTLPQGVYIVHLKYSGKNYSGYFIKR